MGAKTNNKIYDDLLVFFFFFFATLPAWFFGFWRSAPYIYIEPFIWGVLVALAGWRLYSGGRLVEVPLLLRKNSLLFPFLIFSGISVFWSVLAEITLARWVTLLLVMGTGIYIRLKYDFNQYIEQISLFALFMVFFANLIVLIFPEAGVMYYYTIQGAWRGVFWHKNHLGLFASFANVLFLSNVIQHLFFRKDRSRLILWTFFYFLSLLPVIYSDSVAAYITSIFLHGFVLLLFIYRQIRERLKGWHYFVFALLAFIVLVFLFSNLDFVFAKFNRNATLTGRVPMWTFIFEHYFQKRPVGGYGFNAFWQVNAYTVATQYAAGYPDPIIIADNGFIDVLMNTGYLGLTLFLVFYVGLWWRSIKFMKNKDDFLSFFPIIFMSYTLLANISWSLIYESESFFMLLMISLFFHTTNQPK